MKHNPLNIIAIAGQALLITAIAWLVILVAEPVMAQNPTQPVDVTNQERNRQQQQNQREWLLRNLANQPEEAKDPRHVQALMAEIEQDFKRILIRHNELARSLSPGKTLDFDLVSEATAEIRKRAAHLQTTLALTRRDDEQNEDRHQEFTDTQMRDAVTRLCKQIKSFVTNPVIESPGTVNAQQLTKARHDLQDVIDLSGNLKKSADKLKKTSQ
jgi:hypothetical protein